MEIIEITKCNDLDNNNVLLKDVQKDVEYMYTTEEGKNYFITISKRNGQYVGYGLTIYGLLTFTYPKDSVFTELTEYTKEVLIYATISEIDVYNKLLIPRGC